jgi:hypothetical protein
MQSACQSKISMRFDPENDGPPGSSHAVSSHFRSICYVVEEIGFFLEEAARSFDALASDLKKG